MDNNYLNKLRDHKFYLENFCKIKTKNQGLQPFILKNYQKDLFNTFNQYKRVIIRKARQMGCSTAVAGYFYVETITNPGINSVLIGYNADLVTELLDKIKTFLRTTPLAIRPTVDYDTKDAISFSKLGSKIFILPSTKNMGSGYTIHNCLHGDTKVIMRNYSRKRIEDVVVGDFVYNSNGELRVVVSKTEQKIYDNLLEIFVNMVGQIKVTKRHKIFILDKDVFNNNIILVMKHRNVGFSTNIMTKFKSKESDLVELREAKNLKSGDYIAYPKNIFERTNKNFSKFLKSDDKYYYLRISLIKECREFENIVYDIGLKNDPHIFVTECGCVSNCLVTELAKIDDAENKMNSLMPAIPITGRMVIESTPTSTGSLFHRLCMTDNNGWEKRNYGWWWDYTRAEIEQIKKDTNDDRIFAREYELTFLSSGRPVFDYKVVNEHRKNVLHLGQKVKDDFTVYEEEDWIFYKKPDPDGFYVIGVDPSTGVLGGDFTVAVVFDKRSGEEVAMYRGLIDQDRLGEKLNMIGRMFNNAMIVVEVNYGLTVLSTLRNLAYPNIYFRPSKYDAMANTTSDRMGWRTTFTTKDLMMRELGIALRKNEIMIHSKIIIDEMSVFVWDNNNNMGAESGWHDDSVVATAMVIQGFKSMYDKPLEQIDESLYLPRNYAY